MGVFAEVQLGWRDNDVLCVEFGIIEYLFVVVLRILLAGEKVCLFLGVFVVLADLSRRPELPLGDI